MNEAHPSGNGWRDCAEVAGLLVLLAAEVLVALAILKWAWRVVFG